MITFDKIKKIVGAIVLFIAMAVYFMSAQRTGSLWDCGEFILGAHKLQVVHPPGAPLFLVLGRIFGLIGDGLSSSPGAVAFGINLMSGLATALAAMFMALTTLIIGKVIIGKDEEELSTADLIVLGFSGIVAGLSTAFSTSVWFSAVEGEVYALSLLCTASTIWASFKWYELPDNKDSDRWLLVIAFISGLSVGIHLLSLLATPMIGLLYYLKKWEKHTRVGILLSMVCGAALVPILQKTIIEGIPLIWQKFELILVNSIGLPQHSGLLPAMAIVVGFIYWMLKYAKQKNSTTWQLVALSFAFATIGYSTIAMVVIRANADPSINMNSPTDVTKLIPYINREQYGERPLLYGPHYEAEPINYEKEDRYGWTGSKYEVVNQKMTAIYKSSDKILFPRISHSDEGRKQLYKMWQQRMNGTENPRPSFGFSLAFFFKYQVKWMWYRYFMWNFVGRQNFDQGYYSWDKSSGNWMSGISAIDQGHLYNMSKEPLRQKEDFSRNNYYFLPLILGLIGIFISFKRKKKEFYALALVFLIMGIGLIVYSNQPPNEPRERDYVLVGSFITFCIWIGLGVLGIYELIKSKIGNLQIPVGASIGVLALAVPGVMGFQNFDDASRSQEYASRDYAANFLNSLDKNAILFTYGDNDTYPLWYCQEVEGIRKDVRVVNLSLVAVDWYIERLRRGANDSKAINLTIPTLSYIGSRRNQLPFSEQDPGPIELSSAIKYIGENHPVSASSYQFESMVPGRHFYITTQHQKLKELDFLKGLDSGQVASDRIEINLDGSNWLTKGDLAVLDIIASNIWDRPIYFCSTVRDAALLGLNDYCQLHGMALRITPFKTPSDPNYGIYGFGGINTQKSYEAFMNKFQFGNFDKKKLYVWSSYGPAVQSHKLMALRLSSNLIIKGEIDKAEKVMDRYFEGFPSINFAYDNTSIQFIKNYADIGKVDKAKKHLEILLAESIENMEFYLSLDIITLNDSYQSSMQSTKLILDNIKRILPSLKDEKYQNTVIEKLKKYEQVNIKG